MPMIVENKANVDVCSVTKGGIGMMSGVVKRAGWKIGDMMQVGFIENACCLLLRKKNVENGFKLAYANKKQKSGGKVYCVAFIQGYLQTVLEIPKRNIKPIYLNSNSSWDMALILDDPEWEISEFTKAAVNKIDKKHVGVYELLGRGDAILRIGEGQLYQRLNAHLKDPRFSPTTKKIRYVVLRESNDGQLFEKIRIKQFEAETGVLPRFQEIRA